MSFHLENGIMELAKFCYVEQVRLFRQNSGRPQYQVATRNGLLFYLPRSGMVMQNRRSKKKLLMGFFGF